MSEILPEEVVNIEKGVVDLIVDAGLLEQPEKATSIHLGVEGHDIPVMASAQHRIP